MATLKNPVTNFPISGLTAVIVTGMLLFFNYHLSRVYLPKIPINNPPPVNVKYVEPLEPVEIDDTVDITQEPVARIKNNATSVNTNPPVATAPAPPNSINRPRDIEITKVNPGIDFHIPRVSKHFTLKQVDQRPRVLKPVAPIYPYQATVNGIEGRVVLRFIVDEDGKVQDPEVVKAEPKGVFEEAALAAIVKYKFMPATIGKKKVKCVAVMPIGFEINQ